MFGVTPELLVFAERMAEEYGAPVLLVGSALEKEAPRDIDLRIKLPDEAFHERYGSVPVWIAEGETGQWTGIREGWSNDCTFWTHQGWDETGLLIDFQVYPLSWAMQKYGDRPTRQLTRGEH